jgi:hypothetical protein
VTPAGNAERPALTSSALALSTASQTALEIVDDGSGNVRNSQVAIEALHQHTGTTTVGFSQLAVEVLVPKSNPTFRQASLIW